MGHFQSNTSSTPTFIERRQVDRDRFSYLCVGHPLYDNIIEILRRPELSKYHLDKRYLKIRFSGTTISISLAKVPKNPIPDNIISLARALVNEETGYRTTIHQVYQ